MTPGNGGIILVVVDFHTICYNLERADGNSMIVHNIRAFHILPLDLSKRCTAMGGFRIWRAILPHMSALWKYSFISRPNWGKKTISMKLKLCSILWFLPSCSTCRWLGAEISLELYIRAPELVIELDQMWFYNALCSFASEMEVKI